MGLDIALKTQTSIVNPWDLGNSLVDDDLGLSANNREHDTTQPHYTSDQHR